MKKILFITLLFISCMAYAQQKEYFYVELADTSQFPEVTDNEDGTFSVVFQSTDVNDLLKGYVIYKFERLSLYTEDESLIKTYSVECDDIKLMSDMEDNFPGIFVNVEQHEEPKNLFTPNDYASLPPYNGWNFETRHLDLIGAQDAWDITHGTSVVGINEYNFYSAHEELSNKILNATSGSNWHGSGVAAIAAGNTDNNAGFASIGFDCMLAEGSFNSLVANGSRVINMSWGYGFIPYTQNGVTINIPYQTEQDNFTDLSEKQGIVLVAAAGNGVEGNVNASQLTNNGLAINAENYASVRHFPASYKDVISVSTVGNWNQPYTTSTDFENWIDIHKVVTPANAHYNGTSIAVTEPQIFHQHNDSVDIVVPAYRQPVIGVWGTNGYWETHDQGSWSGTSFSAPIVSGTVGLMFSVNEYLKPKEVESILKLTAVDIELLPENLPFYGRLGGGRLDAFKAVEMANEMAKPYGTVYVTDRRLYRNWFYKLETAPFEIKMKYNLVTEEAKLKFFARDNIEILSGDYNPTSGYVELQIDPNLSLSRPGGSTIVNNNTVKDQKSPNSVKLYPNPNNGIFTISVAQKAVENLNIELFDVFGKSVFKTTSNSVKTEIDISNLPIGIYLVKLTSNEINEVLKLIKN